MSNKALTPAERSRLAQQIAVNLSRCNSTALSTAPETLFECEDGEETLRRKIQEKEKMFSSKSFPAPPPSKRKRDESEEDPSTQGDSKRKLLHKNENGNHSILTSNSLMVILKSDALPTPPSKEEVSMRTKKETINSEDEQEMLDDGLDLDTTRQVRKELDRLNRNRHRRLEKQRRKKGIRKPGRDPIGTPVFSSQQVALLAGRGQLVTRQPNTGITKVPARNTMFGLEASPSATEANEQNKNANSRPKVCLKIPSLKTVEAKSPDASTKKVPKLKLKF